MNNNNNKENNRRHHARKERRRLLREWKAANAVALILQTKPLIERANEAFHRLEEVAQ